MSLITAPGKYASYPGNANLVYDAICKVLSERQELVNWAQFGADEWRLLAQMAETEGVGPLLCWILGRETGDGRRKTGDDVRSTMYPVPDTVQQQLRASYYQTAARNAVLFQELEGVLAAFDEAGIPVIVLKGAALAQTLYPDPGLRPMGDLDLLIQPADLRKSLQALKQQGYARWKMTQHAMLVGGPQHDVTVELHWNLIYETRGAAPEITELFAQLPDTRLQNTPAHFLYLAAHLVYQHAASARLCWGYDLYLMLKMEGVDWHECYRLAAHLGWESALGAAIHWVQGIFDIQLPPALQVDSGLSAAGMQAHAQGYSSWMQRAYRSLSWQGKITWLLGMFFPSANYLRWRYHPKPEWLWPFYLLRRWFEIGQDLLQAR